MELDKMENLPKEEKTEVNIMADVGPSCYYSYDLFIRPVALFI